MFFLYSPTISLITIFSTSTASISHSTAKNNSVFRSFFHFSKIYNNTNNYLLFAHNFNNLNKIHTKTDINMAHKLVVPDPSSHNFSSDPSFIPDRLALFKKLYKAQQDSHESSTKHPILVELPNGNIIATTTAIKPIELISNFSKNEASKALVAEIFPTSSSNENNAKASEVSIDEDEEVSNAKSGWILWDLTRPLESNCKLKWYTFDSQEGSKVFWHSSSHLMGYALEKLYGGYLGIGPPVTKGFYYDCYIGNKSLQPSADKEIESVISDLVSKKAPFERLVCTREEALELMSHNPFKQELILKKVPVGANTVCYRCGDFVDLCTGPHLPSTGYVKAYKIMKFSSSYWLGDSKSDSMQRVYGVSFPDKAQLKSYLHFLEESKQRDHRIIGTNLGLFYLDSIESPGSCFWLPKGAKIYNRLIEFLRHNYYIKGYQEVITPNIYSCDLWRKSGHYENYRDSMFIFEVEGKEWGMKPMNCPGHCILFKHMNLSYRQLPLRMADFGVLHRNELSGSLSGLVRARRFQQDDAHIFCSLDQVNQEIINLLKFLLNVYNVFGFTCKFNLSTKPLKAIGEDEVWTKSEAALQDALEALNLNWSLNPGDGAFYGPKIDVLIKDCLGREHQCGTIQLDFNLPERFNLEYRDSTLEDSSAEESLPTSRSEKSTRNGWSRPVMIHRAIFGSLERFIAILLEQLKGKLPFWLSPSQIVTIPVADRHLDYANEINQLLLHQGFNAYVDSTSSTVNRKIRQAQLEQVNFMIVVGDMETETKTVTIRERDSPDGQKTMSLEDMVEMFKELNKWPPV